MDIDQKTVVKVSDGLLAEHLGEELAILNSESGLYFGLNAVGAKIWELLQEARSLEAVSTVVASEFEVEPARCQADVQALVRQMLDAKLVQVVDESAS